VQIKKCWQQVAAITVVMVLPNAAFAQDYPNKPLRLIVPFTPGGVDTIARILAQELPNQVGQPVVVDNRAGAAGTIGTGLAANARADGYTLLFCNISFSINLSLYPKLPYDTLRDFAPVSMVGQQANLLVVHPGVAAKSVKELVALAKAQPGRLNYGSGGTNTALAMELFKLATGSDIVGVSYNGIGPAMISLLGGQIQMTMSPMTSSLQHVQSGKLRALGISDLRRTPLLPELPTLHEAGVPNYEYYNWYGVVVPAATPRQVVQILNKAIAHALASSTVKKQFLAQGLEGKPTSPEGFAAYLKSEVTRFANVVKVAGMKPDQ
jgi:tripartite-type tricarboxylate transporter receptor subunit TctC